MLKDRYTKDSVECRGSLQSEYLLKFRKIHPVILMRNYEI